MVNRDVVGSFSLLLLSKKHISMFDGIRGLLCARHSCGSDMRDNSTFVIQRLVRWFEKEASMVVIASISRDLTPFLL